MPRNPRLMYLATSSSAGGAERQVHDLAVRMVARGWDVTAVSMLPLGVHFEGLPTSGVATASLGMQKGRPDPRALVRLGRLLRDRQPDVLHAHMVHANLLARISRLVWRTPVVVSTMHNQYQGARWRMAAYRVTDRLGDTTTAVSDAARDEAIRLSAAAPSRLITMPNGIDTSRFAPDPETRTRVRRDLELEGRFIWLAVGRLTAAKDYPNLVQAVARLVGDGDDSLLLIAGAGPDEGAIRDQIAAKRLDQHVRLLGLRSDVADLMRAADGFVMSSAWEGLPLVLLEAGASSLPIVATDVGGNRDAVIDGESGYIVQPRNERELAERMSRVAGMHARERQRMGAAGRSWVTSRFDIEEVVRRWQELYWQLLSR